MQVRISDSTLTEGIPGIAEGDLQVSRHHVSDFLSAHTAYELLPESGKVWMLPQLDPHFFKLSMIENISFQF